MAAFDAYGGLYRPGSFEPGDGPDAQTPEFDEQFAAWLETVRCPRHGIGWRAGCSWCWICIGVLVRAKAAIEQEVGP